MIWDIELQRRFDAGGRRFELRLAFRSASRRLVLFGPSGAGKSQAVKMIAGLTTPDAGHVRLDGLTLYDREAGIDLPARQRQVAYVFQDYALFPHLTTVQNVAFGLHRGWRNAAMTVRHEAVRHWMAAFGLESVARLYPAQLSGGQRQRTAIARALVAQPRALLLDEPFAALDPALRTRLRDELAALQSRLDIPMLVISHDPADLRSLGDEVLCLDNGRLAETPPGAVALAA